MTDMPPPIRQKIDLQMDRFREQANLVKELFHKHNLFGPNNKQEVMAMIPAMMDYAQNSDTYPYGQVDIEYFNVRLVFQVEMQDVRTDGSRIQMSPAISNIEVIDFPFPIKYADYQETSDAVRNELGIPLDAPAIPVKDRS